MYDSVIDYNNIPSREIVLDKGYYEGATIILNDFCYPNVKYNNDYKISELILPGDEGIIKSIDALGILHVLWKDQYEVPVVVGRDTFKLKTQDIETENDENALTFISHRQYLKNYRIYGNTVIKNNETLGVGDRVTDTSDKYYGLYKIPIVIESETGESEIKNIYIDEPLYSDENGIDYLDFNTQKIYLRDGTIKNIKIPFIKPISNDIKNIMYVDTQIPPTSISINTNSSKSQNSYIIINNDNRTFIGRNKDIRNYRIYGNSIERKNLFNGEFEDTISNTIKRINIKLDEGNYVISSNISFKSIRANQYNGIMPVEITMGFYPNCNNAKFFNISNSNYDISIYIEIENEDDWNNIEIQIEKGEQPTEYEPYIKNNAVGDLIESGNNQGKYSIAIEINDFNTEIILDNPLNTNDYLDYRKQMRINSDGTTENINLPKLEIFDGINVFNVNIEMKPERIILEDNITIFEVSSWQSVQTLVRSGLHKKYFAIGDQLVCQKGNSDLTWDIIGFDHDIPTDSQFKHSMTLQLHDCLPSMMQFDAPEALYYVENGLAAGTYNFTIQSSYDTSYGGGKTYQFTLENDIEQGGQITFGWSYGTQAVNAKITSYDEDLVQIEQVSVTEGNGGTSLGTTDGTSTNLNHIHRVRYGSNNYVQGAIRQFLNSDKAAGSVWESKTNFDRPPVWNSDTAGFMSDLDSDFLAVVGAVHKIACINNVTDGGGSAVFDDKFFLLSRSEVYGGNEVTSVDEGSPYPYYSDYSDLSEAGTDTDTNRIKYRSGTAQVWGLRSSITSSGSHIRMINATGAVGNYYANNGGDGVAPACNII